MKHNNPLCFCMKHNRLLHNTTLNSIPLHKTSFHKTLLCNTLFRNTTLQNTLPNKTALHNNPLYNTQLSNTIHNNIPLYNSPLYNTPLHNTLLFNTTPKHETKHPNQQLYIKHNDHIYTIKNLPCIECSIFIHSVANIDHSNFHLTHLSSQHNTNPPLHYSLILSYLHNYIDDYS